MAKSYEDTKEDLYIATNFSEIDGVDLWAKMQAKWPRIKLSEYTMEAEHTQTKCFGYDLYDSSDYTNFIHIRAKPEYFTRIREEKEGKRTQA